MDLELQILRDQAQFVSKVVKGTLKLRKMRNADLQRLMEKHVKSKVYDCVLDIQTRSYTKETLAELNEKVEKLREKIEIHRNLKSEDVYAEELAVLKETVQTIEKAKKMASSEEETFSSAG